MEGDIKDTERKPVFAKKEFCTILTLFLAFQAYKWPSGN